MAELAGDAVPQRSLAMAWQTIDGETVLLHIDQKELLGVNEVGARVWALCDGVHSIDAIIAAVTTEFSTDTATAAADVRAFLAELLGAGALELGKRP